jgi:hypothetical protein
MKPADFIERIKNTRGTRNSAEIDSFLEAARLGRPAMTRLFKTGLMEFGGIGA